jgi:hypothetical protein
MKKLVTIFSILAFVSLGVFMSPINQAAADSLLFDRGLPTSNLNDAAEASRSNVAWADWEPTATTFPYYLPGDDFKIVTSGLYNIDKITVWSTDNTGPLSLYGGQAGGTISKIGTNPKVTSVKYANNTTYQTSSGTFINLYQVDFSLSWNITGGQTYQFFLDGPYKTDPTGGYDNSFLHASNKDKSGSRQDGANNSTLWLEMDDHSWPKGIPNTVSILDLKPYWDKSSDFNIRVYGTPVCCVPLPGTLLLLGSGLAGLGLWRGRKRFKA